MNAVSRVFLVARGVAWTLGFVLLWTWIATSVRTWDDAIGFAIPRALRPIGWGVAAAGALLAVSCIATFLSRGRGTPAPFDAPRVFVASGPYRWVRNPMYLGAAALILGVGLAVGSPAIVLLAPAFLLIAHVVVITIEEPGLAARFGDAYEQYRANVAPWHLRVPRN